MGVDNVLWNSDKLAFEAIDHLRNLQNYKAQPVRRVFIPKPKGGKRALGIPTMFDRAVQTLYAMALLPIAEVSADTRSYGYRPLLGAKDAMVYLHLNLSSYTNTRRWVLEADIEKFFDRISHNWLLDNIPLPRRMLKEFLASGIMTNGEFEESIMGTPQGGVISPIIANMCLDGLQKLLEEKGFKMARYADDFVVLGKSSEDLQNIATPLIDNFLSIRGVNLSKEKTKITSIVDGFDFLGFHIREYPDPRRRKGTKLGICLITPQRSKVLSVSRRAKQIILDHQRLPLDVLIVKLNYLLRGWAEYFRMSTCRKAFSRIGYTVFYHILRFLKKRYKGSPVRAIIKKYFKKVGMRNWIFYAKNSKGEDVTLFQIGGQRVKRHSISKPFNPFLIDNEGFLQRKIAAGASSLVLNTLKQRLASIQKGICPMCEQSLFMGNELLETHHKLSRKLGGADKVSNLVLLHRTCHVQITHTKSLAIRRDLKEKGLIIIKEIG